MNDIKFCTVCKIKIELKIIMRKIELFVKVCKIKRKEKSIITL